jgi:hypothetical protein
LPQVLAASSYDQRSFLAPMLRGQVSPYEYQGQSNPPSQVSDFNPRAKSPPSRLPYDRRSFLLPVATLSLASASTTQRPPLMSCNNNFITGSSEFPGRLNLWNTTDNRRS